VNTEHTDNMSVTKSLAETMLYFEMFKSLT